MAVAGLLPGYPYVSVFSGVQCRLTRRRPRQSSIASTWILESNDCSLVRFGRTFDRLALDFSNSKWEREGKKKEFRWREEDRSGQENITEREKRTREEEEGEEDVWNLNNAEQLLLFAAFDYLNRRHENARKLIFYRRFGRRGTSKWPAGRQYQERSR